MALKKTNDPHDRLFRWTFSDLDNARDFFEEFLPTWVVDRLDLQQLTLESELALDEKLTKMITDVVFSVPMRGMDDPAFLVLLLEHKSTHADIHPTKMERYRLRQMEEIARKRNMKSMPLVIPYLVYHGEDPFRAKTNVKDTVTAPKDLVEFAFQESFHVIDLESTDDEALLQRAYVGLVLLCFKYGRSKDFQVGFRRIFAKLKTMIGHARLAEFLIVISNYLNNVMAEATYDTAGEIAIEYLGHDVGGVMITAREAYLNKGREEGIIKNKEETAVKMLRDGLGSEIIAKYTSLPLDRIVAIQQSLKTV